MERDDIPNPEWLLTPRQRYLKNRTPDLFIYDPLTEIDSDVECVYGLNLPNFIELVLKTDEFFAEETTAGQEAKRKLAMQYAARQDFTATDVFNALTVVNAISEEWTLLQQHNITDTTTLTEEDSSEGE